LPCRKLKNSSIEALALSLQKKLEFLNNTHYKSEKAEQQSLLPQTVSSLLSLSLGLFLGRGNVLQAFSKIPKKHGINSTSGADN